VVVASGAMGTPPTPILPPFLLALLAKLAWRAVTRSPSGAELGELYDPVTGGACAFALVQGSAPSAVVWGLLDGTAAPPLAPVLLDRHTFTVLHGGAAEADGAVSFEGRMYRIAFTTTGAQLTASAVAATTAA
jgi:hypothetical protein